VGHPKNPNVMSKSALVKLKRHLDETGNYEPVVVRKHPSEADKFEIINGHHRIEALRQLGCEKVACLVWDVDDAQTLVLLESLNRLNGKDDPAKKAELLKELTQKYDTKTLALLLPDSRKTIERLANITKPAIDAKTLAKTYLNSIVLFVDDEQLKIINDAMKIASAEINSQNKARRDADAAYKICKQYVNLEGRREK
jgi:ParB family chromosome partitioning protein